MAKEGPPDQGLLREVIGGYQDWLEQWREKDKLPVLAMRKTQDDWRKEEKEGIADGFNSSWSNN